MEKIRTKKSSKGQENSILFTLFTKLQSFNYQTSAHHDSHFLAALILEIFSLNKGATT